MEHIYKAFIYDWKSIIKRSILGFTIPIVAIGYTILNKNTGIVYSVETIVDKFIPFVAIFSVPYIVWYAYIMFFASIFCIIDGEKYLKLIINLNLGMIISYIIYYFFPTYVPRPQIIQHDIFSRLVAYIFLKDNPYNCFPSIHVLNSVLVAIYVNRESKMSKGLKIFSTILCVLICMSTMFIKQHFLLDAIAGTIIAYILYFIAEYTWNKIREYINKNKE